MSRALEVILDCPITSSSLLDSLSQGIIQSIQAISVIIAIGTPYSKNKSQLFLEVPIDRVVPGSKIPDWHSLGDKRLDTTDRQLFQLMA